MSKHTPGPWRIAEHSNIGNMVEAFSGRKSFDGDNGFRSIGTFQDCTDSDKSVVQAENRLANGRLIAAAPELLEALQRLYDETASYITINKLGYVHHNRSMKMAFDAIAKAEAP